MPRLPIGGVMKQSVTWQQPGAASVFDQRPTWNTVGTYRCQVRDLDGRELVNARQIKATITTQIIMRNPQPFTGFCPVKANDRFLFESSGRVLNVDYALRIDEGNAFIKILATELAGETP